MAKFQDECVGRSGVAVIRWFGLDRFEPERAVTSHFVSSRTFLWIRLPILLYSIAVLYTDIIWTSQTLGLERYFAYFTDLTFIGLHAYLVTTIFHHIRYLWSSKQNRPDSFLEQPAILNYLYVYLYHTIVTFNIVTPVIYWALLSKDFLNGAYSHPLNLWITPSLHGVSFVMMMVDVIFNRMVIFPQLVLLVILNVIIYMCLTFIVYATQHWWVYSFLDWSQGPSAAVWYGAVMVFIILCFFLQLGIHTLRDWIVSRGQTKTSSKAKQVDLPEMRQRQFKPLESSIASHITIGGSSTDHLNVNY